MTAPREGQENGPAAAVYHARQERTYRLFAPFYDRFVQRHTHDVCAAGVAMLGDLHGATALDVGTGTGNLAIELARAGAAVVGIDLSPSLLDVAARKFAALDSVAHIEAMPMDARQLAFADGQFEYACAAMVMHEMPGPVRGLVLAEMARVASRGLLIIDYQRGRRLHWGTRFVEWVERSAALCYLEYPLEQVLATLGLQIADTRSAGQFEAVLAVPGTSGATGIGVTARGRP